MATTRRKIHTHAKYLAYANALPASHLQQLSRSQISKYKNHFKPDQHFGHDLDHLFGVPIDTIKLMSKVAEFEKLFRELAKILVFVKCFFITQKQSLQLLNDPFFVTSIHKLKNVFPTKRIARFLQISPQSITVATRRHTYACTKSIIGLCSKKYFHQLTPVEITHIKNFDKAHTYWPLCSIFYRGLRDGIFKFSLQTFYKYCRKLGIKKYTKKNFRSTDGLVSYFVNQYWNADVTQYRTKDGVLWYIYLVMDHYSKKILAWDISTKKCGKVRVQTFRTAVLNYLQATEIEIPNHIVQLIVDAGSENNNGDVDDFIGIVRLFLKKVIALKDITHSNSPIEAINKIVKNSYLNKMCIADGKGLRKALAMIVNDYNNRPHGSLKGTTPTEEYAIEAIFIDKDFTEAKAQRKNYNKNFCCKDTS